MDSIAVEVETDTMPGMMWADDDDSQFQIFSPALSTTTKNDEELAEILLETLQNKIEEDSDNFNFDHDEGFEDKFVQESKILPPQPAIPAVVPVEKVVVPEKSKEELKLESENKLLKEKIKFLEEIIKGEDQEITRLRYMGNRCAECWALLSPEKKKEEQAKILKAPPPKSFNKTDETCLKRLLIQRHIVLLLHAQQCQLDEEEDLRHTDHDYTHSQPCTMTHCRDVKNVLEHMRTCVANAKCLVAHCASSRKIILHWNSCQVRDCPICAPLRQQSNKPLMLPPQPTPPPSPWFQELSSGSFNSDEFNIDMTPMDLLLDEGSGSGSDLSN